MYTSSSTASIVLIFVHAHGFIVQEPIQNASIQAMYTELKQEIASLNADFVSLQYNFANVKAENKNLETTFDNLTKSYEVFDNEIVNISKGNSDQQSELRNIAQQLVNLQTVVANLTIDYQQTEQQYSTLGNQYTELWYKIVNQTIHIYNGNLGTSHSNESTPSATNDTVNDESRVGFSVSMPEKATFGRDGPLKFTYPIYNNDEAFNFTTAKFTCKIPGLYFFSSIILRDTGNYPESFCYLMINDFAKAYLGAYSFNATYGNPSGAATILYHMLEGDTAYIGMCGVIGQIAKYSNFNGFLINAD